MRNDLLNKKVIFNVGGLKYDGTVIKVLQNDRIIIVNDSSVMYGVYTKDIIEIIVEVPKDGWKVELTYFKQSGKNYSSGEYRSFKKDMFDITDEINEKVKEGKLPGLVEGCSEFIVLVDVPDHPHNYSSLCNVKGE